MTLQVSLIRILINDNNPITPTYSDAQLQAAIGIPPPVTSLPDSVRLAAFVASVKQAA